MPIPSKETNAEFLETVIPTLLKGPKEYNKEFASKVNVTVREEDNNVHADSTDKLQQE